MSKLYDADTFSAREWTALLGGFGLFIVCVVVAITSPPLASLPSWIGWVLAVVAILGLVLMVATIVRGLLRTDTQGVERQEASRASMISILFIVVAGFCYSLLEAFAGLPRLTAAVPSAAAGLVWMIAFAWNRPQGDV